MICKHSAREVGKMKYLRFFSEPVIFYVLFSLIFPPRAYAYLDPGSGSYFLQLIIGGLFGALFSLKIFWKSIKSFLSNVFSKKDEEQNE